MIFEDDPYYFLYYGKEPRPLSYFSLEKELGNEIGRVLRFDSLSKIVAAGFRIGWLTGPNALISAIERHVSGTHYYANTRADTPEPERMHSRTALLPQPDPRSTFA